MNKLIYVISVYSIFSLFFYTASAQCIRRDENVEAKVEAILSRLTLEEKIGQMCELTIDKVAQNSSDGNVASNKSGESLAGGMLSAQAVSTTFGKYKVGSILNVPEGVAQTPEVWADVIRTLNAASLEMCGVPQIFGVDQVHGASYTWGATLFPQEIGLGASFNPEISRRIGEITAYESRACLIPWVYSPVMDIARSPLWPRLWESFGEDVLVNSVMGSALVKGLQGEDPNNVGMYNVAACLKHYLAYGAAVSGKDRTPSSVTYREMMEKYFQPFKACCEAGALSIMVNSANNNGVPFHANRRLLTEWLKEGLDWDGMIVTDWADIDNIWKRDRVAANKKEAIAMAINAGIDMTMDPYSTDFCDLLLELVHEGKVPMERIDDAVRRILRLRIRVGLMDRETWDIPYEAPRKKGRQNKMQPHDLKSMYRSFGCEGYAQEAVKIAEECMVLLKNENSILPLKQGTKIFVCGPNADNFRPMNGGWSYTWQGHKTDEIVRQIGACRSFYEALREKFGAENVEYSQMVRYDDNDFRIDHQVPQTLAEDGNSTADKIARADVLIAFVGENSYTETPGNIDDLNLSANQLEMVRTLQQSGKPVILVLNEGRPRLIDSIVPQSAAIVQTFLPGNYGGDALANLLSGEANFSGRLPYTYPKYHGSFITYDCKPCEYVETMAGAYNYDANTPVQWPFGFGLSYSDVKVSELKLLEKGDVLRFGVTLTNNSDRAVKEPVLLFISDLVATLTPDIKRLRAFEKVSLEAGESKNIELSVRIADLAFVNEDLNWVLEPGEFRASVGDQSVTFAL